MSTLQADALDPELLYWVTMAVEPAHRQGKWIDIRSGLVRDEQAVPILLGLGGGLSVCLLLQIQSINQNSLYACLQGAGKSDTVAGVCGRCQTIGNKTSCLTGR